MDAPTYTCMMQCDDHQMHCDEQQIREAAIQGSDVACCAAPAVRSLLPLCLLMHMHAVTTAASSVAAPAADIPMVAPVPNAFSLLLLLPALDLLHAGRVGSLSPTPFAGSSVASLLGSASAAADAAGADAAVGGVWTGGGGLLSLAAFASCNATRL